MPVKSIINSPVRRFLFPGGGAYDRQGLAAGCAVGRFNITIFGCKPRVSMKSKVVLPSYIFERGSLVYEFEL